MTGRRADARDLLRPKTPPPCADGRYGEANEGNWRAAASISLASRIVRATPKPCAPAATLQQFAEVMCGFSRSMQHGRVLSVVQIGGTGVASMRPTTSWWTSARTHPAHADPALGTKGVQFSKLMPSGFEQ